ncbi:MAG TPA: SDR family oxidoreductase [Bryobacteraceae bacterium]|nr:SDR family oxidoreductase [Bryobacteraceae bacterium]
MEIKGKSIVVTGGANGIGRALCLRFAEEGARSIAIADLDGDAAEGVASEVSAIGSEVLVAKVDVAEEEQIVHLVKHVEEKFGPVDLFCSNAGIFTRGGVEVKNEDWQRIWEVNVMSHVYAARAVLPGMIARGHGYLLQTASAAGLLSQIGSAPYAVTKHAAVGFAEWLQISHYDQGIRVSVLCPQGVRTAMLEGASHTGVGGLLRETAVSPEQVADAVVKGIAEESFLILPHPEVAEYFLRKATDYPRWLRGMRKLQAMETAE